MDGAHDGVRPVWSVDHAYVFLQHHLIAGSVVKNAETNEEVTIPKLSIAELWKDRGNAIARESEDWEVANEWYTHAIDFLVGEVKAGRAEAIGCQDMQEEGEGVMKKMIGFLCGRPSSSSVHHNTKKPKLTETDKFLAVLYSNQSLCYAKRGQSLEALNSANFALKHNPKFLRAFFRKVCFLYCFQKFDVKSSSQCTALIQLGKIDEARIVVEEGLLLDPVNADLLRTKSQIVDAKDAKNDAKNEHEAKEGKRDVKDGKQEAKEGKRGSKEGKGEGKSAKSKEEKLEAK